MPVTVVLDHPRQHVALRLARRLRELSGALLLLVGLLASLVAFPTTLLAGSFVVGWLSEQESEPDPWPSRDVPVEEILLAFAVSTPVAVVGLKLGLRLLRGDRKLVLFLRRFGYDDATKAVTFAAAKTIGGSWRLVTLDDAEIAPLGVPVGAARLFGAGRWLAKTGSRLAGLVARAFPVSIWIMCAIVAIELLRADDWRRVLEDGTFDPYFDTAIAIFELRLPLDAIGPHLPGLFAVLAIVAALVFAAGAAVFVALLLSLALAPLLVFVSSSADAVREAEAAKTHDIRNEADIARVAVATAERSRKVFAPRLVVLRVSSPVWQATVSRLASVAAVPLIDVSVPTENLLWELEELTGRFGSRCLVVGEHDRVVQLVRTSASSARTAAVDARLLSLIDGSEVLAYTTDRRGMRRFARALRAKLLTLAD